MTKINQEEYHVLKSLGDKWKWIARDNDTILWVYEKEPRKHGYRWDDLSGVHGYYWDEPSGVCESVDSDSFQFIQWGDENPFSIAELIEEYEKDYKGSWEHVIEFSKEMRRESEGAEVKSKQELIEKWESAIEAAKFYGKGKEERLISYMKDFVSDLSQLDEQEVLSPDWLEENEQSIDYRSTVTGQFVESNKLQNLIVPKQELPVIPDYVEERIEKSKENKLELGEVLSGVFTSLNLVTNPTEDLFWIRDNQELFARAWLDGFTVEEEEEKYYLKIGNLYLAEPLGDMTSDIVRMTRDKEVAYQFTDEKSITTHLDKFEGIEAVKVEELEE